MSAAIGVAALTGFFHYAIKGPKDEPEDDPDERTATAAVRTDEESSSSDSQEGDRP